MADINYPCFIARLDGRGHWYWTYYLHEDEAIASSEKRYLDKHDCERSIRQVQDAEPGPIYFFGL